MAERRWRPRSRETHVATAERSPFAESQRGLRARETRDVRPRRTFAKLTSVITVARKLFTPSTPGIHSLLMLLVEETSLRTHTTASMASQPQT